MDTKDITYFLNAEQEFCNAHPTYGKMSINKDSEMTFIGLDDRAYFLIGKPFAKYYHHTNKIIENEEVYGLTLAERVLLKMFYCEHSVEFRDDYYYDKKNIPQVISEMFNGLNNIVKKAPLNNDKILYRFCCDYDPNDMKVGDVITFPYNLTCTNFDWHQDKEKNVYVITPLPDGNTKAHNLYEIYEHGDEKQVNFLRETSFKVTKIEKTKGSDFVKIHLEEIA